MSTLPVFRRFMCAEQQTPDAVDSLIKPRIPLRPLPCEGELSE